MQNINISNYHRATASDINNLAEFLMTKMIERINEVGRIIDGQMGVFIVTPTGFNVIVGHQNNPQELLSLVQQYQGKILLKSFTRFNSINPHNPIYDVIISYLVYLTLDFLKYLLSALLATTSIAYSNT